MLGWYRGFEGWSSVWLYCFVCILWSRLYIWIFSYSLSFFKKWFARNGGKEIHEESSTLSSLLRSDTTTISFRNIPYVKVLFVERELMSHQTNSSSCSICTELLRSSISIFVNFRSQFGMSVANMRSMELEMWNDDMTVVNGWHHNFRRIPTHHLPS